MNNVEIVGVIPARGGSKGIPGKNIKLLGGYPLIAYSIIASRLSGVVDRTIVSTDSDEIQKIALRYGADVPFLRPVEFAQDDSTDYHVVNHAIEWMKENEATVPEFIVYLRPTTPLRDPGLIDDAIGNIKAREEATSLRSAHPAPETPYKWFKLKDGSFFESLFDGMSNEEINGPRQNFPEAYMPDGYVDIFRTSFVSEVGKLLGDKMISFISPTCSEVDTAEDFEYLFFQIEQEKGKVYSYLKEHYPPEE